MASLFEFSTHIAALKKEKKYNDALNYFKENKSNFSKEQISKNEYIISDLIYCLRYTNHFDAGFQFLSIYEIEINNETKERIISSYGWLLWSKYKVENLNSIESVVESNYFENDDEFVDDSNFHYNKNELLERVESLIVILLNKNNDFSKTLISNLFSIVLKSEKQKPSPSWKLISEFCDYFNPEQLSIECSTIQVERKGEMKDMELASDKENWYAYNTKALLKLGEWQKCFDISKEALEKLDSFHYSNDIWFSRRVALSKRNLGNTEETISELTSILRKKREWFIQKEIAELYYEKDDFDRAFKYVIDAINNFGPLEFKVDLLFLIGQILLKKNEKNLAFKHFSLSKLIRQSEEWKIPQKLFDELNNFEITEIITDDIGKLKSELKKYWNGFSPEKKKSDKSEILKGKIVRVINHNERGKDGFLKHKDKDYYFSSSSESQLTSKIEIGALVEFKVLPKLEGKKLRVRLISINL